MKKNKFIQHIPGFVSGVEPKIFEFNTTKELLAYELLDSQAKEDPYFFKYVKSGKNILFVAHNEFYWWCKGSVQRPELVDLPKWEGGKSLALLDGKEVILQSDEIQISSGDRLILRDGREAIDLNHNNSYKNFRTKPVNIDNES